MEAGFMRVVEVGQYFVTKDTGDLDNFTQWLVANTPFHETIHLHKQKDDVLTSVTSYGTVKYVIDSNQDNTEVPADPQEGQVPQTSIQVVAARSKAKAKPQPRELVGTTATIPIHARRWIDIESSEQNLASYDLSKKVINLLRHNQTLQREEDGALEFYKIEFHLRNHHSQSIIGLMMDGKLVWLQEEDRKGDINIALIIQEESFTSGLFNDILETISLILRYRTMW